MLTQHPSSQSEATQTSNPSSPSPPLSPQQRDSGFQPFNLFLIIKKNYSGFLLPVLWFWN